nr:immunoglobulin heavy chain junction region [Macaca mulatta]MOV47474.1 immunoglobulin heavy chain junction region [Macaca mulatta]MOV47483.1 immunoglobulin heavy chain junction region [Macaca mulatta]MOV47529.1 immunoglobulin heavy chain junction region [Macaca mulatta]MOV47597.1 immunoglobulin heavy chain junction region [Macaca mulatta]
CVRLGGGSSYGYIDYW